MFEGGPSSSQDASAIEKYYGKYPGLVLKNTVPKGDDDYGDHRGELEVEVPGILEETPDGKGQQPIKVLAKPCFHPGHFFIPENQTQVWVEFAAGDINSPLWTGVWYPKNLAPPTVDDAGPTEFQKIIRSASGHSVQLDDSDGEEQIVVRHKEGSSIKIDKDGHITIEHKDGLKIELKAENTVEINSDKVQINADVVIDGNLEVTGDVTVGQGLTTTISGNEITGG